LNDRAKSRIIELAHVIEHGMSTYPGLPGPEISDHLSRDVSRANYAPGTEFQIGRITLVANTGTYVDTPFHRYPDGPDLSALDLSKLVDVDGVLVDATGAAAPGIGPEVFSAYRVTDRAVLVRTGWDRHWRTPRYGAPGHPFLTADAVAWLVAQRPAVVGIDSVNIDDMADMTRPAHTGLLAAHIPIIEHMSGLDQLPTNGFRLHAAPVPVVGMGSFPVRAYAVVPSPVQPDLR
jgi:kynurenine formamidase